jgi:hypothetical protein
METRNQRKEFKPIPTAGKYYRNNESKDQFKLIPTAGKYYMTSNQRKNLNQYRWEENVIETTNWKKLFFFDVSFSSTYFVFFF